jgi:two-component SAPR family response regulator
MTDALSGLRAMIVEDEALIAMHIEDVLEELGVRIVGRFRTVGDALASVDAVAPDLALLDVNLGEGVTSLPIAEHLSLRGVPFAFLTGYGRSPVTEGFPGVEVLSKPIDDIRLGEVVMRLASQSRIATRSAEGK